MTAKRGMSRSIMMVPGVSKKLFAKCFYLNVKPRRFPAYKLFLRWRNVGIVCGRNIFRSIRIVVNLLGKFPKTKHIILKVWIQIGIRTKNSPFLFEKQKNNNVFAYFIFINEKVKKLNLNVK